MSDHIFDDDETAARLGASLVLPGPQQLHLAPGRDRGGRAGAADGGP